MNASLILDVRLLENRYHGRGDWPPSPMRLFQALVAGAHGGRWTGEQSTAEAALRWLEGLEPPSIAYPSATRCHSATMFVPNNDLDAVGGDPCRVGELRTAKQVAPWLIEGEPRFLYAWRFDGEPASAQAVCVLAQRLYRLGAGVDSAFVAVAEIVDETVAEELFEAHGGAVTRPTQDAVGGDVRRCPHVGTLDSLKGRHEAFLRRLQVVGRPTGRGGKLVPVTEFRQPPVASWQEVPYGSPPRRLLFELLPEEQGSRRFSPWPLHRTAELVTRIRDGIAQALRSAGTAAAIVDCFVLGRGAADADKVRRLQILPLPSIGSPDQTDHDIRRVALLVPSGCPLPYADIVWACARIVPVADPATGEVTGPRLVPADGGRMLSRLQGNDGQRAMSWRTLTPVLLDLDRPRGRLVGDARAGFEAAAAFAARQALRHAGITVPATAVRVQREPFQFRGERADAFEKPGHLRERAALHVALDLLAPVSGPLVLGDGRFFGLGLLEPVARRVEGEFEDVLQLPIGTAHDLAAEDRASFLHAVRRALMALAGDGQHRLETLFSGHAEGNGPSRGAHAHLFLAATTAAGRGSRDRIDRLLIIAPWCADRTARRSSVAAQRLNEVVSKLRRIIAGPLGVIEVGTAHPLAAGDPLLRHARLWRCRTPFQVDRHLKQDPHSELGRAELRDQIALACERRGMPRPAVKIISVEPGRRGGLRLEAELRFAVAIAGPVIVGRDSHMGGGLFEGIAAE